MNASDKTIEIQKNKIHSINSISLNLFNGVVKGSHAAEPVFIPEYGVYLSEHAAYARSSVEHFLKQKKKTGEELNKTFHKSWKKIQTSSRLELAIHQILHYMSTYGASGEADVIYLPNETLDLGDKKLPVYAIGELTRDDLIVKCKTLLGSGIALDEQTMKGAFNILQLVDYPITDVEWIKNKEAKLLVINKLGVFPKDPTEFLRYVLYKATDRTLLIKDAETLEAIQDSYFDVSKLFTEYGVERLAEIFNRFKPIFLAFKKASFSKRAALEGKTNPSAKVINRIAKLSKTMHVPMVQNPLNQITSRKLLAGEEHWLQNATGFALLKALNVCHVRMAGTTDFAYKIRNGKSWVTTGKESDHEVLAHNRALIERELAERFGDRFQGKSVFIPDNIRYGLPTSEKMFLGKFPIGTTVLSSSLVVGIYWEDDFGAEDLDLSGLSVAGKVGWDSAYDLKGLQYSGDVTRAPNGAVEYLRSNNTTDDILVQVNCYNGNPTDHSYNIIVASADKADEKFMMNPENLILNEKFSSNSGQSFTGLITTDDGKSSFSLFPLCGSNARIGHNNEDSKTAMRALVSEVKNGLTLNDLLVNLGAYLVETAEDADFNLSTDIVEKSTFVDLFS